MPRPDKIKLNICTPPKDIQFATKPLTRKSVYADKLTEAFNSEQSVQIVKDDVYMMHMLRKAATKLGFRLLFAVQDNYMYIKPTRQSAEHRKLLLMLRSPRTIPALRAWMVQEKLEMDLTGTLQYFASEGLAIFRNDNWLLTPEGKKSVEV